MSTKNSAEDEASNQLGENAVNENKGGAIEHVIDSPQVASIVWDWNPSIGGGLNESFRRTPQTFRHLPQLRLSRSLQRIIAPFVWSMG